MGVRPVSAQRASFDTVRYAFAIFIFMILCTIMSLSLLLAMSITLYHIGATYRRSGSIASVYIDLRAAYWSPQLGLADLDSENINFVHFRPCSLCAL